MTRDDELTAEERARRLYRGLEMQAAIMRDQQRTGGWEGAERVARAFERQAESAKVLHAELARTRSGEPAARPENVDEREKCIACAEPFEVGQRYLPDQSGGFIHVACCGPERESYVGEDGQPLGPDEPIPEGVVWSDELATLARPEEVVRRRWIAEHPDATLDDLAAYENGLGAHQPPEPRSPAREEGGALRELVDAVVFFDKVKNATEAEKMAVGTDHWNRLESAARQVAALAANSTVGEKAS